MRPLFVLALTVLAGGCSLLEPSAPSTAPSPTTPTPAAPAAATPESAPAKAAKPPGDGWTDLGGGRFVRASSTLSSKNDLYVPAHLVDGDPKTTWVEGASGVGQGEWIEVDFGGQKSISELTLINGVGGDLNAWKKSNRTTKATLTFSDGSTQVVDIKDFFLPQTTKFSPKQTSKVRVTFDEVSKGVEYNDLCVSELYFK